VRKPGSRLAFQCGLFAAIVAVGLAAFGAARAENAAPVVAVAPQYDKTHVYAPPEEVGRFAASFHAAFGGRSTDRADSFVRSFVNFSRGRVVSDDPHARWLGLVNW
jgi:hypothetical protein